jgi:Cytochrome P450
VSTLSQGAGATPIEAVDLLDHDLFSDHEPWEVFDRLQREAPVFFHAEPQGRGFWALTKYADVLAVLKDPKTFSSELGGAATIEDLPDDVLAARRNFLEFDPPKHGKYRRLLAADFTPKALGRYEEWLRHLVRHRLESALARNEFDLVHELAAPIPIQVLGHILGLPEEELPRLVLLGDRLIADTEPELEAISSFIEDADLDLIQMRNLNIDPELYRDRLPAGTVREGFGIGEFMQRLKARFPHLQYGYFNPSKETYSSWRAKRSLC